MAHYTTKHRQVLQLSPLDDEPRVVATATTPEGAALISTWARLHESSINRGFADTEEELHFAGKLVGELISLSRKQGNPELEKLLSAYFGPNKRPRSE